MTLDFKLKIQNYTENCTPFYNWLKPVILAIGNQLINAQLHEWSRWRQRNDANSDGKNAILLTIRFFMSSDVSLNKQIMKPITFVQFIFFFHFCNELDLF